jgi:hypothetical protein
VRSRAFECLEDRFAIVRQSTSGGGQLQNPTAPFDELDTDFDLELAQMLRRS